MKKSKWILYRGDFELYHSMLLHNRRTHQSVYYPPMWRVDAPSRNVLLYKKVELEQLETLTVYSNTKQASFLVDANRYPVGTTVTLEPGKHFITITSWQIDGETIEIVKDFIFLGSKITEMVTATLKLKDTCSLEEKLWST